MESWKQLESLEGFEGLNALDVGSPRYKEYFKIMQELSGSHDNKKLREAEYLLQYLGLKLGVAVTLNPSPMLPLDSESKYAVEHGLKIELCEDGYYRWFKRVLHVNGENFKSDNPLEERIFHEDHIKILNETELYELIL
jgi:hypothetical protein